MAGDRVLTVRIAGSAKGAVGAIKQTDGALTGIGKKMLKIGAVFGGLTLGKKLVGEVVNLGKQYDLTMNTLQAASGATGKQMEAVGDKAKSLGADLSLPGTSAIDSTAAMLELYKGGLNLTESMNAAKGSIQLASAASIDNAEAAQIQANAMSQFGLKAKNATMVADTLANVSNSATGEITDVANALSYVGPVASAVGMSIGQTSTAIGLLAKNGIISQKAGTALRASIASLAKPTATAAKGLEKLNIQAFDGQGKFKGMRYVTDKLAKAKKNLTDKEFQAASAAAFGREPLAAINALAKEGHGGWDKMAKAVERQGTAARIAKAKNKGFGGAVDGLKSQLEDTALMIWEKVEPALDKAARLAAKGVSKFNKFAGGLKKIPKALKNLDGTDVGKKLTKMIGKGFDAIGKLAKTLADKLGKMFAKVDWVGLGIELGKAVVPMLAGLAIGILNFDLVGLLKGLAAHWQEVVFAIIGLVFMPAKWAAKLAGLLRKIPFIGKLLGWIVEALNKVGSKIKGFIGKFFKKFWSGFKAGAGIGGKGFIKRIIEWFSLLQVRIGVWAINMAEKMGKFALRMAEKFGKWLGEHGPKQAISALKKLKDKIFGFFKAAGSWLMKIGGKILKGLWNGVKAYFKLVGTTFTFLKDKILGFFGKAGKWLFEVGKNIIQGMINGVKNMAGNVVDAAKDVVGGAIKGAKSLLGIHSPSKVFKKIGEWTGEGFVQGLHSSKKNVSKMMKALIDNAVYIAKKRGATDKVAEAFGKSIKRHFKDELGTLTRYAGARDRLITRINKQTDKLNAKIKTAKDFIGGMKSSALEFGSITNVFDVEANGQYALGNALSEMESRVDQMNAFRANLRKLAKRGLNKGDLRNFMDQGVETSGAIVSELANANNSVLKKMNNLRKQMGEAGYGVGYVGYKEFYKAGVQANAGLIKGLKKEERKLAKQANRLAHIVARAVRRALKIKSPSRVFEGIGQYVSEGLGNGMIKGIGHVEKASDRISSATMFDPSATRATNRPSNYLRGSAGAAPINVNITVEGNVIGEKDFAKRVTPTVRNELLKIGKRNGGKVL